ncbi:MAG: hypothetical protein Q8O17_00250 [Candidatus Methanoperedens sp.]|nr:hypothetical protein [Candidatus Methanoperedens sp.]
MKNLQISEKKFKQTQQLYKDYSELYGGEDAVWDIDDLDELRQIGQEFMEIFAINYKK